MNNYNMVYTLNDGTKGVIMVCAANRMSAFMVFEDFGIENVVDVDCFRILNENEE